MKTAPKASAKSPSRNPRRRMVRILAVILGVAAVAWVFHGAALGPLAVMGLEYAAREAGYEVEVGGVRVRLDQPFVFQEISIQPAETWSSKSSFLVESLEIQLSAPWKMFGSKARLIDHIVLQGARLSLDTRSESQPPSTPMQRTSEEEKKKQAGQLLWLLPQTLELRDVNLAVLGDDWEAAVRGIDTVFDEASLGQWSSSSTEITVGDQEWLFGSMHAATAWKAGEVFLADMEIGPGLHLEQIALQLTQPGGIGFNLAASLFGGLVRGGAFFGEWRGEPGVDATLWASGLDFAKAGEFLKVETKAAGTLDEGRLTFRGNPSRPMDAEISVRLMVSDVLWGERGWQSLLVSASLINRRLSLTDLTLQQEENKVTASGEIAVSGNWQDMMYSPFLLNTTATIQDMSSLGILLGGPFENMTGRMTLRASLYGRSPKVDGFLTIEASEIGLRGRPVESAQLDVAFQAGEARVDRLEIWSGGDRLTGKGAVALAQPHSYSGEVNVTVSDLGAYAWIGSLPVHSGGFQLHWQGDGQVGAHSGIFESSLNGLVTQWTPRGVSGQFSGTYSPGNIYFGEIELTRGNLGFSARATLASSGVKIEDLTLHMGNRPIAAGEAFLPVNPFALALGKMSDALLEGKSLYAELQTQGELEVADLFTLAGQKPAVSGQLSANIKAGGPWDKITAEGKLTVTDMVTSTDQSVPPVDLSMTIDARDGYANFAGTLDSADLPQIKLEGRAPFGLVRDEQGQFTFLDPAESISGRLEIPETKLEDFAAFLPDHDKIEGSLVVDLTASGSASEPRINGTIRLSNGQFHLNPDTPQITELEILANVEDTRVEIQNFTGRIGAGPFQVTGNITDFARYDLTFRGEKILLFRSSDALLRANADILIRGDRAGGEVSGAVLLVDGRLFKRLEVTPLIAPLPRERDRPFVLPNFQGLVPAPFDSWKLNVRVANATPFTIVGNIASGEIQPELTLGGTLGAPVPVGSIGLRNARAFLPFTILVIDESKIDFVSADPWMPYLDVRGNAESLEYQIQVVAFGPLSERNLILRSEPPLSQESIILLLGAGLPPGEQSGAGFGEAAVSQGSLLLLRTFLRQFEWKGVDSEALLNRIQISSSPSYLPDGQSTLRGSFRLWDGFSLVTEQDELGFYNVGASYRFRFR